MIMCSSLQYGWSSLMKASEKGHNEIVRILLSSGAKVDLTNQVSATTRPIPRAYGNLYPDVMLY